MEHLRVGGGGTPDNMLVEDYIIYTHTFSGSRMLYVQVYLLTLLKVARTACAKFTNQESYLVQ